MPEWRVLIADDEPTARRGVRLLLASHPGHVVVGECRNGREVLESIPTLRPDVIFLDIEMPELSGLDVIRQQDPGRMPAVVFLTAHDKYALPAFDTEAIDYLVKPVSPARFARAIRRLTAQLIARRGAAAAPHLVVSTTRGSIVLQLDEIDWIESADHHAKVWSGGTSHLMRESLGQLDARVAAHGFVRAHRGALVRLAAVRALRRGRDGRHHVELRNGTKIPVARRRSAALQELIGKG